MAFQVKFTGQLGRTELADITIEAGDAEAQSDTISINIDVTAMEKGAALMLIDTIRDAVHAAPWPPLS